MIKNKMMTTLINQARLATLLLSTILPTLSIAAPGIQVSQDGPDFATAKYEATVIDLKVKVQGGYIKHQRRLEDGIDWQFNRAWRGLQFEYAIGADPSVDLPNLIKRNDFSYNPIGSQGTPTYVFDERTWITKTINGWRWQDRLGNWIDYDASGQVTAYADRNNVTVSFTRDADGRIETVKDHNNIVVLTYVYNATTGLLESATDYTSRSVGYTYDALARLKTVTDVRGEVWTYGYTDYANGAFPLLTSITDPETHVKTIAYDIQQGLACVESTGGNWSYSGDSWSFNNASCSQTTSQPPSAILKSISDEEGLIGDYKFFYTNAGDDSRYKTAVVNGAGGLTVQTYNISGDVLEVIRNGRVVSKLAIEGSTRTWTDENGRQTIVQYDQWNNAVKETYADGSFITRTYDANYTNVTSYTDENGVTTKYDYYPNGKRQRITEALGLPEQRITEYAYDLFGNQTQIKTLADAVTAEAVVNMTYDNKGNLSTYLDAELNKTEYLLYDVLGNVKQRKDARLNVWLYDFDATGNLIGETTPLGFLTSYVYDKVGNLTTITDANLKVSGIGYDKRNRPISVTNQLLEPNVLAYNGRNQITTATNALGHVTQIEYNQDGQLTKIIDPSGNSTTWDYGYSGSNSFKGPINTVTYPTFQESFNYDERYRLSSSEQSSADTPPRSSAFDFDPAGNLKTTTDSKNRNSENSLDSLDRTISILDTAQQLSQLAYDSRDNPIQVTNARAIAIRQYQYDRNNRVLKELLPDGSTIQESSYNGNGNLDQTIDAKGQVADYIYGIDNRLIKVQYFSDIASAANPLNALKTVDFTYNKLNRLKTYNDGGTSGSYVYDVAGQLKQSTVNYGGFSLGHAYTYYASGLKKTYTGPDNITYTYNYDVGGKLQSVTIPGQGNYTINQYQWMQPELVTLPGGGKISVDYDGFMRGKRVQGLDPAGNSLLDAIYTFDPLDNIEVREALEAKYEYGYDNVDRLTSVDTTLTGQATASNKAYDYDPVGNRITDDQSTWIYDDNDRLQQRGEFTYEYDANGSRTKQTNTTTGEIRNYTYNLENRLSEILDGSNNLIASYSYDPFGRRISKTVGAATTYFYYSDQGLVAETDGIGAVTTTYGYQLNTPWGTDPMFIKQGGQYGYYITDHLGSPQIVVAGNGSVLWEGVYDAFGGVNVSTSLLASNLRFPGQYFDGETGLHYNYFRYYDANTGGYISGDPIGLRGGVNTYAYVGGNPIRKIDPYGLKNGCGSFRRVKPGTKNECEDDPYGPNDIERIVPGGPTPGTNTQCSNDCLLEGVKECSGADTPDPKDFGIKVPKVIPNPVSIGACLAGVVIKCGSKCDEEARKSKEKNKPGMLPDASPNFCPAF